MYYDSDCFAKTDTDATFMRMKEDAMKNGQLKPAYNIQYGTDSEFVTWATVGPQPTDTTPLIPFLQEMEHYIHKRYRNVVADAGYESEENYLYLETNRQRAFIKSQHSGRRSLCHGKSGYEFSPIPNPWQ